MSSLSIGDLAQSFLLQRRGTALKTEMSRLTQELASGRVSDIKSVLAGNFSYLSDIENSMTTLAGYKVASTEATQFADTMQSVLENVQNITGDFATNVISVASGGLDTIAQQSAAQARQHLGSIVSAFNTDVAGRNIFSGTASDRTPLAASENIIDALRNELAGVVGHAGKLAAAQAWFDDPAGFEATLYRGSDTALAPFRLSETEDLSLDVRANADEIKDVIMHFALAGLADDATLNIQPTERSAMLLSAGEALLTNQDRITAIRAEIGFAQSRIDHISTRNASELTTLEYAKGSLLEADPYETATRLEEVQFQLQSLYAVTARSSELSLLNYLR